jgi:hypothetical protein
LVVGKLVIGKPGECEEHSSGFLLKRSTGLALDWKPLLLDTKPLESSARGVILDSTPIFVNGNRLI